ncbi:hypothetical protein P4U44_00075, partial [Alkalihalobacillus alcalophilus]|uniref:hypothetical protein n=1 Tax=Alkalihalobacillus alcalophilus TaxID=1445 RepID=UPI002E1F5E13|nr:hypothetical protein [Alkalihalobacillus alcalophilus]
SMVLGATAGGPIIFFLLHSLSVWCDSAFSLFKRVKGICLRASLSLCQLVERIFSVINISGCLS